MLVEGGGGGGEEGGIAVGSGTRWPPAPAPSVSAGAASESTPEAAPESVVAPEAIPPSGEGARCAASPTRDLRSGGVPGNTPLRLDGEDRPPALARGSPLSSEVRNMSGGTSSSATISRSISDLMPCGEDMGRENRVMRAGDEVHISSYDSALIVVALLKRSIHLLCCDSDGLELVKLGTRDLHPVKHLRLAPRDVPGSAVALLDALGALVKRS